MNPVPPLTADEVAQLRASIVRDGVQYPVLVTGSGRIIDGFHRQQICAELGVKCPTEIRDVDDETADRLSVTLNLARRQLSPAARYDLIAWLDSRHQADADKAALERKERGWEKRGIDLSPTVEPRLIGGLKAVDDIADRINTEMADLGQSMRVSGTTIERTRRWSKLPEDAKKEVRDGKVSLSKAIKAQGKAHAKQRQRAAPAHRTDPRILDRQAEIRAADAELQYQSMLNAPRGKLNLPLLRRVEKVQEYLDDVFELDPVAAARAFPVVRCPEFTATRADWWARFVAACETRWHDEAPDLPPARPKRLIPLAERDLTRGDQAVLAWLRNQEEPVTAVEAAWALQLAETTAVNAFAKLVGCGLAAEAGLVGRRKAYTVPADGGNEGEAS